VGVTETTGEQDRDKIIRAAYTAAGARLRDAHHDEFIKYQIDECDKRGVEWKPRESAEQKAEAEFDRLLQQYPYLRDRLPIDEDEEATG